MLGPIRSQLVPFLVAFSCAGLLWVQYPQRLAIIKSAYQIEAPPPLSNLQPAFVNVVTLGFKNVYDDFVSIWLIQSLVDSRKRDPEKLVAAVRSVIRHHPKLETTYLLPCFVLFRDFNRPDVCQEIIIAGLQAFPSSWRLPMTQGYVHYFLLKQPAQAASFFMMAASRPKSPPYVKRLVSKLLRENNLSAEDLQMSLDLMEQHGDSQSFKEMLRTFGKWNTESHTEGLNNGTR